MRHALSDLLQKHPSIYKYRYIMREHLLRRFVTSPLRRLPDFLIIGVAKCGTTSLYDFIIQHPDIEPALTKEITYFTGHHYYGYGSYWYRAHFPMNNSRIITGEATPTYLPDLDAPMRVKCLLPNAKLIVLLRNPVDRAYSHYNVNHEDKYSFETALRIEDSRVEKSGYYPWWEYKKMGLYADQLERWFSLYPRKQFLILETTDMKNDRQGVVDKIFKFLRVRPHKIPSVPDLNVGSYNAMKDSTRKELVEFFKPHNERLYKLLGFSFNWDK